MPPQFENNVPPVNNIETKQPRGHKFLITLFGLFIISAGFAWWYLCKLPPEPESETFSTKTDEFADWKTYRNEELGFEFKYPSTTWYLSEDGNKIGLHDKERLEGPSIWIDINQDNLQDLSKKIKEEVDSFLQSNINEGNLNFANIDSIYIDHGTAIGSGIRNIIFTKGENTFWIRYDFDLKLDEKILSTFKFISTSTPLSTSTYTPTQ